MRNRTGLVCLMCVLTAILSISVAGCGTGVAAKAPALVSTQWLQDHLGDRGVVVLDVRTDANYGFAHIPGAVHIAYTKFEPQGDNGLFMIADPDVLTKMCQEVGINHNSHVVVYAHGNTVSDASKAGSAFWAMKVMGHDKVSMLDGGFTKWTFEGREVSNDKPAPSKGNFKAKPNHGLVADISEVNKAIKEKSAVLVDARNSIQYFGHEKRADVTCYGHIAGAVNLPADFLSNAGINRAPATIRGIEDLKKIAAGVGIPADRKIPLIVYCNTGQLAGLNYLVLNELLGYSNVKVYDGSMLEYCAAKEKVPVQRFSWDIR